MSVQVIPLTSAPNQSYNIQLQIDGKALVLNITVKYNEMAGYWILGIFDSSGNLLVDSVPMITGSFPAANILAQQRYLGIGAWYVVNVSNLKAETGTSEGYGDGGFGDGGYGGELDQGGIDYPNNTNLGTDFQLWVDDTPPY